MKTNNSYVHMDVYCTAPFVEGESKWVVRQRFCRVTENNEFRGFPKRSTNDGEVNCPKCLQQKAEYDLTQLLLENK